MFHPESLTVTQGPALITLEVGWAGLSARREEERQKPQSRRALNILIFLLLTPEEDYGPKPGRLVFM